MDYSKFNLDSFLKPINSPVFKTFNTSYDFNTQTERSSIDTSFLQDQSITNAKIVNLTADKVTAGTISSGVVYAGTINGSQVTAGTIVAAVGYLGTISANQLNAGTINASNIAVINIDADKITTGEINCNLVKIENLDGVTNSSGSTVINGGKITTGTIDASVVDVDNINANNINAGTLTGRTVRTSSSSTRVSMEDSANELAVYNSGTKIIQVDEGGMWVRQDNVIGLGGTSAGVQRSQIFHSSSVAGLHLDSDDAIYFDQNVQSNGNIALNNTQLNGIKNLTFRDNSNSPSDREVLMDDDGSNQRMRVKFANNGTQWQFDLSSACEPVTKDKSDVKYKEKYDLMEELDDSRFKYRWADDETVQKEYRGMPKSHFPSMGNDGTEWKQHMDANWKRSWLPMKSFPDRMETMGQFPYAPPESPLIGETESKANIYQLMAHGYNKSQDRVDELLELVSELTDRVIKLEKDRIK